MKEVKIKFNLKLNEDVSDEVTITVPKNIETSELEAYISDYCYDWLYKKTIIGYEINDDFSKLVEKAYNHGYSDEEKYLSTHKYKETLLQRAYFLGRLDCQSNKNVDNIYNHVIYNPI